MIALNPKNSGNRAKVEGGRAPGEGSRGVARFLKKNVEGPIGRVAARVHLWGSGNPASSSPPPTSTPATNNYHHQLQNSGLRKPTNYRTTSNGGHLSSRQHSKNSTPNNSANSLHKLIPAVNNNPNFVYSNFQKCRKPMPLPVSTLVTSTETNLNGDGHTPANRAHRIGPSFSRLTKVSIWFFGQCLIKCMID